MDTDMIPMIFLEIANEEAGIATELEHVMILGKQGSMVYAATRSYLNLSTLTSAGASSAYCIVQYCPEHPHRSCCFSDRCCEPRALLPQPAQEPDS